MRTENIKLTNGKRSVEISNPDRAKIRGKIMGNRVQNVNCRWIPIFFGILIGLAIPFLIDWAMFGTPIPCKTVVVYEDGGSLQTCEVRG